MNPTHPLIEADPYLKPFASELHRRESQLELTRKALCAFFTTPSLAGLTSAHTRFGLHRSPTGWVFKEFAPGASAVHLIGDMTNWKREPAFAFSRGLDGCWSLELPERSITHGMLYKLAVEWPGGSGERIPAFARRVLQDPDTKLFAAQVWAPEPYSWRNPRWSRPSAAPLIYEAHVGMAQEEPRIGSYREFTELVLPRVVSAGYNTIQLMAVQEHPYYGSFGYQVSSFFAPSSRFGTPEELKELVDTAHGLGLAVIMDLVHSHAVKNESEGLSRYDGTYDLFFHGDARGFHPAWDTRCFNYGKFETLQFLLSNCRYWLEEFHFDGFRFDGVTSMLYWDRGLGKAFTSYDDYFSLNTDTEAWVYLTLANEVIHSLRPDAITVAEDVSGMPGLAAPRTRGGVGFDFRLAMGTPDYWIKLIKEVPDEQWPVNGIWWELTNRRHDERTISYCESHDQALVGDKTIIFRLADAEMYTHMRITDQSLTIDRACALHKMIRLVTSASAQSGYLNFMGNEFGHPEWIDFPREGNGWSYHYARRQWSLKEREDLRYRFLASFDQAMLKLLAHSSLFDAPPRLVHEHVAHQTLGFERGELLFLFNFSPTRSYADYLIRPQGDAYRFVLSTDEPRFGGFGHIDSTIRYLTHAVGHESPGIKVYLPARSALVLERE